MLSTSLPAHPRLFFKETDLPRIKAIGFAAEELLLEDSFSLKYLDVKDVTFALPPKQPGKIDEPAGYDYKRFGHYPYWTWMSRHIQDRIEKLTLSYLCTEDARYARRAIDYCLALSDWQTWSDPDYGPAPCLDTCHFTMGVSAAYDICYDIMTAEEREKIRGTVVNLGLRELVKLARERQEHNMWQLAAAALGIGALAVVDEVPDAAEYIEAAKEYFKWFLDDRLSSPNTEGLMYASYGLQNCLPFGLALKLSTGDDSLLKHPYNDEIVLWATYFQGPDLSGHVPFSDCHCGNFFRIPMLILAKEGNALAGWNVKVARAEENDMKFEQSSFLTMLLYDPDVPATPPNNLPVSAVFERIGWAALRSGWGPDDTLFAFQSSDSKLGHNHFDQNNFALNCAGEWLITDPGYMSYECEEKIDFTRGTIGHNCILIDGKGQAKQGGGKITGFFTSSLFDYTAGDATGSYSSDLAGKVVRRIAYIRPNTFLVMDELVSAGEPHHFTWLIRTDKDGKYLLDGEAAEIGVSGTELEIVKPKSRLFTELLLPKEQKMTLTTSLGAEDYGPYISAESEPAENMRFLALLQPFKGPEPGKPSKCTAAVGKRVVSASLLDRAGKHAVIFGSLDTPDVPEFVFVSHDHKDMVRGYGLYRGKALRHEITVLFTSTVLTSASVDIEAGSAEIDMSEAGSVRFLFPGEGEVTLDGEVVPAAFDAAKKNISLELSQGKHTINVEKRITE